MFKLAVFAVLLSASFVSCHEVENEPVYQLNDYLVKFVDPDDRDGTINALILVSRMSGENNGKTDQERLASRMSIDGTTLANQMQRYNDRDFCNKRDLNALQMAVSSFYGYSKKWGEEFPAERMRALLVKRTDEAKNCLKSFNDQLAELPEESYEDKMKCVDKVYRNHAARSIYDIPHLDRVFELPSIPSSIFEASRELDKEIGRSKSITKKCQTRGWLSNGETVWREKLVDPCNELLSKQILESTLEPAGDLLFAINRLNIHKDIENYESLLKWVSRAWICKWVKDLDPYTKNRSERTY